jgi:hypothetical protein
MRVNRRTGRPERVRLRPAHPGDCFLVIMATNGLSWDGARWVPGWRGALRFAPLPASYPRCEAEAARLRRDQGVPCFPLLISS